ncbi:MAG: histidine phosphatase family protein [Afipia sp.]|nr:histidine phosphatase family protein [Afipia sp.]
MRRLILLRHAKTERDAPSGRDFDRQLEQRGLLDARDMAQWLVRNGYTPDLVWVSTARRAQQTWDILSQSLTAARAEHFDELYNVDAGDLLNIVRNADASDPKTLMIVAHNPALHELALALISAGDTAALREIAANLPTTGVAIIDFASDDWGDAGFRKGTLERFVSPKLLKAWSDNKQQS